MMTSGSVRADGRLAIWQARVDRHRQSGKSVKVFCQNEGISEASFYLWRKKIGADFMAPVRSSGFVAVGEPPVADFGAVGELRIEIAGMVITIRGR